MQTTVDAAIRVADRNLPIRQSALHVAGYPALALYGMPGMFDNVQVYLAAHDRLYRLLYAGAELDSTAWQLLNGFQVISATKTLESLHLPTSEPPTLTATAPPTPPATAVPSVNDRVLGKLDGQSPSVKSITAWTAAAVYSLSDCVRCEP